MKTGSFLAAVLFSLVALAHLARILTGTPVIVGETSVSMWISALGVILPAAIAWLLWRESR
jgi:hypothetical protein